MTAPGSAGGRRVVITGTGVCWADAESRQDLWQRVLSGAPPPSALSKSDPGVTVLRTLGVEQHFDERETGRLARSTRMAVVAGDRAFADAGRPGCDPDRGAAVIATASAGAESLTSATRSYDRAPPVGDRVPPALSCRLTGSQRASTVLRRRGWHGPAFAPATACAAGNDALAQGVDLIRSDRADVVLAGGTDAPLSDPLIASMRNLRVLASDGVCSPFGTDRHGFLMAEGAAVVMLESLEFARSRGAKVLAEIVDWESTCDAFHISAPDPTGRSAERAIVGSLRRAGFERPDIAAYSAHGTGTDANDRIESAIFSRVLAGTPVLTTKGITGHPFAASAVLEAIVICAMFEERRLPGLAHAGSVAPEAEAMNFSAHSQPWVPGPVLSAAFGLGGVNTAIVIAPWRSDDDR